MSGIHTEVVSSAHAYTRSDSPWIMERHKSAYGKLIHYLSGGGMRTFGRTVRQEEARRRHRRFIAEFAILAAVWFLLLVV